MTVAKLNMEFNWVVGAINRHTMALGFFIAGMFTMSGLGFVKYQQHVFNKQPASSATLAELPICAKKLAEVRIAQRQLLTNGDLKSIQAECDAPANTLDKQSEALSANSLPRK